MVLEQLEDQSVLVQLVFMNSLQSINKLITEANCDVNEQDKCGRTALHAAAFNGYADIVDRLLLSGARGNKKDDHRLTPLHRACINKHDNVVEKLLFHNADVTCTDRNWLTPLHFCAMHNALNCAKYILPALQKDWINKGDHFGRPPLHYAAYLGNFEIVEYLLENGADASTQDKQGRQAIHWACGAGHWDIARLLFMARADMSARDRELMTPLHCASSMGHLNVVSYLLGPEGNVQVNAANTHGHTPLHLAVNNGHLPVVKRLTENSEIDIDARDLKGFTPLHYACASSDGYSSMLHLIQKGANVKVVCNTGSTVLHLAAVCGRMSRVNALLKNGVNLHAVDKNGDQAIMVACRYGHEIFVKKLLNAGADPNCIGRFKRTPLHTAVLHGFGECARSLVELNADIEASDEQGRTPLHFAAHTLNASSQCVSYLLHRGAKYDVLDSQKRTPLHYACIRGNGQRVELLIAAGADATAVDVWGRSPMHYAAISDNDGSCLSVLKIGGAEESKRDAQGLLPIHFAAANSNNLACKMLFDVSDDIFNMLTITPISNTSALHLACKADRSFHTVQTIITYMNAFFAKYKKGTTHKLNLLTQHDSCDMTPLMWTCTTQVYDNIHQLLSIEKDGKLKVLNEKGGGRGWNALHFAALNNVNHLKCLQKCLDSIDDTDLKDIIDCRDSNGRTPLMLSIHSESFCPESVHLLLELGANPALRDDSGRNTLHRAALWGKPDLIKLLLDQNSLKADPLRPDKNGVTPLHLAVMQRRADVLQAILEAPNVQMCLTFYSLHGWKMNRSLSSQSSDATKTLSSFLSTENKSTSRASLASLGSGFCDKNGFTPLHWAAHNGDENCLETLLEFGALRGFGLSKLSPIHCAAVEGHDICIDLLVKSCGKEVVLLTDDSNRTPLHLAALAGKEECVDRLCDLASVLDAQDVVGKTPLMLAVESGNACVFDLLISKGANVKMVDASKCTALHVACLLGQETIACNLIEAHQNTSNFLDAKNNKGHTALHIACMKGLFNVVEKLILKGASAWIRDDNDRLALVACSPNEDVADCMELLISIMLPEPNQNYDRSNRLSNIQVADTIKARRSRLSSFHNLSKETSNTTHSSDSEFY